MEPLQAEHDEEATDHQAEQTDRHEDEDRAAEDADNHGQHQEGSTDADERRPPTTRDAHGEDDGQRLDCLDQRGQEAGQRGYEHPCRVSKVPHVLPAA